VSDGVLFCKFGRIEQRCRVVVVCTIFLTLRGIHSMNYFFNSQRDT